jgi:hypothetical protein
VNITALTKLEAVYADDDNAAHRTIHKAVTAVLRLECTSPVVITGLNTLVHVYETKCDLPEIERIERYVVECWAEYTQPTGEPSKAVAVSDEEPAEPAQSDTVADARTVKTSAGGVAA